MQRRLREPLVRIYLVEAQPRVEIVYDGSSDQSDISPFPRAHAIVLETGLDGGDCFFTVGRAAGEHDAIKKRSAIAKPENVGVDRPGRSPTKVDRIETRSANRITATPVGPSS
jgi:hypothetical protein